MQVAQQPAVIHVAHDVLDGVEGEVDIGRVVHGQDHPGHDLRHQHEGEDGAEGPPVVQVARGRIGDRGTVAQTENGEPRLQPLQRRMLRREGRLLIGAAVGAPQTVWPGGGWMAWWWVRS